MSKNKNEKTSEEAYAYTPGLKVKEYEVVSKTRRLPLAGEVSVKQGQEVDFDTIVATTKIPGIPIMMRVADLLGVSTDDAPKFLTKKTKCCTPPTASIALNPTRSRAEAFSQAIPVVIRRPQRL